jgi:hypothetical protein
MMKRLPMRKIMKRLKKQKRQKRKKVLMVRLITKGQRKRRRTEMWTKICSRKKHMLKMKMKKNLISIVERDKK